jgi:DNA-binding NtrC family response regulator
MNRLTRRYGVPARQFTKTLLDACQRYMWPGNLRELENFVKRFLAIGDERAALEELYVRSSGEETKKRVDENGVDSVSANLSSTEGNTSLKVLVRNAKGEAERAAIVQALEQTKWNRTAAARLLRISYRGLLYKIEEYRLARPAVHPH